MNQLMQQSDTREKQRQERLQHNLIQTIQTSISTNVEAQVRGEMRNTVLPGLYWNMYVILFDEIVCKHIYIIMCTKCMFSQSENPLQTQEDPSCQMVAICFSSNLDGFLSLYSF